MANILVCDDDKDIVEAAKQYAEVDIGERELFDLE